MDAEPEAVMDDNSDSSSSGSDEEEQELVNKAEALERQITDNKYLYEAHEELVTLYSKLGDLPSMRSAYKRFHELFPLTPEIWLSWINVEKSLASTETEKKHIFDLFDKAVEDYSSVKLWVEYAQYSIGVGDLETTRTIIEKGLSLVGLHTSEGVLLWDTLRELELAQLGLAEPASEAFKKHVLNLVEIFRRELSVPLIGMRRTRDEWTSCLTEIFTGFEINPEPIDWGYKKALKQLESYEPFEDQLQGTTDQSQLLEVYRNYIKTVSDPSTIICLYERATTQLCLIGDIWVDYCLYCLKLGASAEKISAKALRNCPWNEELWITRLRILESLDKDNSEVIQCFEQAVSSMGPNQGTDLWLSYLEYSRRNITDDEKLHKIFDQALKHNGDTSKIARFYAKVLAGKGKIQDARRVWKDILKDPAVKSVANVWLEYANLERQYGDAEQLRKLYQRAINNCTDWPHCIAEDWLMYERQHGTLQEVLKCVEICRTIAKPAVVEVEAKPSNKRKRESSKSEIKEKKPKIEAPTKKVPILKDPTKTVFISNLFPSINEKRLKKVFPNAVNIEVVVDRLGKSRCYGYVQFNMEEEVMSTLARDRELLDNRPIFISNCKPDRNERKTAFKYSGEVEANKLFVKGLPVSHSQEDVEAVFKPYGAISVRLVLHKSGQSKGLAYVEFADEEMAKQTIEKTDQMKIAGHVITVAISAPPVKGAPKAAPPARHSRSRLQVPLVPRSLQVKQDNAKDTTNGSIQAKSNADFRKMLFDK